MKLSAWIALAVLLSGSSIAERESKDTSFCYKYWEDSYRYLESMRLSDSSGTYDTNTYKFNVSVPHRVLQYVYSKGEYGKNVSEMAGIFLEGRVNGNQRGQYASDLSYDKSKNLYYYVNLTLPQRTASVDVFKHSDAKTIIRCTFLIGFEMKKL